MMWMLSIKVLQSVLVPIKYLLHFIRKPLKGQHDVDALYQGTAVRVSSDQISSSFHKETVEGAK